MNTINNQFYGNSAYELVDPILGWTHIELGAANYGPDFENIDIEKQYLILYKTIDDLVLNLGLKGTLYINDYNEKIVDFCIQKIVGKITSRYPENAIKIEKLVGNYFEIAIPLCGTMHLKNPESSRLVKLFSPKCKDRLHLMASQSKTGLMVQTVFHKLEPFCGYSNSVLEKKLLPYLSCVPYSLPTGQTLELEHLPFSIKPII
jgi:hypothetical protein